MCKCSGKCGCNITTITKGEKGDTGDQGPAGELPYLIYTALLTQEGTSDPVATELENTLGVVTPNYVSTTFGELISSGLFTADKTFVLISNYSDAGANTVAVKWEDVNTISINWTGNGSLFKSSVEIRVYP